MLVIGLYNSFARIPLRLRRVVARLSGYRWIPFDPVLRNRKSEPARREAWLRDQYRHTEEHRHSVAEVRSWEESGALFAPDQDYWPFEAVLSQIGWMKSLGYEGGLFVTIGRKP